MFVTTTKKVTIKQIGQEILISECVEVAAKMAPVQLNCFTVECNYKTQALKFDQAEKILENIEKMSTAFGASLKI